VLFSGGDWYHSKTEDGGSDSGSSGESDSESNGGGDAPAVEGEVSIQLLRCAAPAGQPEAVALGCVLATAQGREAPRWDCLQWTPALRTIFLAD
jgi:hypothetical protein